MPPVQDVAAFLAMRDQGIPLLDVRSPGEFAFAHIPGALNLPLFTDEERAKVGTAHARSGREGGGAVCADPQLLHRGPPPGTERTADQN